MASTKADFSQGDTRWGNSLLGFSTWQKMRAFGCYVAGLANIAQAQGKDVTPADVNRMLKEHGQYIYDGYRPPQKSDVKSPGSMSVIFPDIKNIENRSWGKKLLTRDDFKFFDIRSSRTDDILVMLDYHADKAGVQTHFCRVIGVNKTFDDVEIVDSYTGKRIWVSSLGLPAAKLIYKAYKYRGPGLGFVANVPAAPATRMVAIRINGARQQYWNVRTSPSMGNNIVSPIGRNPMKVIGGQTYSAEIVEGGWARIIFNSRTVFIGPKAYSRI